MTQIRSTAPPVTAALLGVRVGAGLSLLVLLWQFVSAGRVLDGTDGLDGHATGAIALHVSTGILLAGAALHGRATRTWWPTTTAAAVFVLAFAQAWLGSSGRIALHVPVALLLSAALVWLAAWAFRPATRG